MKQSDFLFLKDDTYYVPSERNEFLSEDSFCLYNCFIIKKLSYKTFIHIEHYVRYTHFQYKYQCNQKLYYWFIIDTLLLFILYFEGNFIFFREHPV